MIGLITDRDYSNILRRNELASKGFARMTPAEKAEWLGDPMATEGANLLPPGPYYSSSVNVKCLNRSMVATATGGGIYLYAIGIIGEATKFEGKTFTLSVDKVETTGGGTPQIALYWHDDNGFEFAGASLTSAGTVTFTVSANTNRRANLAAYVYVTTDATVTAGAKAEFFGVMLELGSVRHSYVPYTEVVPTNATKGAYNYSDLNRVERTVAEISDELGLGLITKTDWTMWDVLRESDWTRYINNVKAIRSAYSSNIALPEVGEGLTYGMANNIERILLNKREWRKYNCDIRTVTEKTYERVTPSGEIAAGRWLRKAGVAWWSSYDFDENAGFYYFSGFATHYDFTGVEVTESDVVGLYIIYTGVVYQITALNSVDDRTIGVTYKIVDECKVVSTHTYDVYLKGSTSYGTIETEGGALPEEGTIIEGSVSEGYYVLLIDGEYYYYKLI